MSSKINSNGGFKGEQVEKSYISTARMYVFSKTGRVVTGHNGLSRMISHEPLITWSLEIT